MRPNTIPVICLACLACTPATDLQQEQAAVPSTESTSGPLTSPTLDPLAGVLVEPPPGSVDLPTNLAAVVVRFSEEVQTVGENLPFVLRSASGNVMALALGAPVPCAGRCYQLVPGVLLDPSTLYTLEALPNALEFLDGKPSPAGAAGSFTTGARPDPFSPRIEAFTVQVIEGCLLAHLASDEPVRTEITVTAGDGQAHFLTEIFASIRDSAERLPDLPGGVHGTAMAHVSDRAGNGADSAAVALDLPPRLPHLVITEVLANPAGSENTQEFVEIYNAGSESEFLGGLVLADKAGSDVLPDGSLPPGAFALIVSEGYDAADSKDPAPRNGTAIVRVPGRLGGDGLSNAGEPVRILTGSGFVVSQYGGWIDTSATAWSGKSVKRTSPQACDARDAWSSSPTSPTPGW